MLGCKIAIRAIQAVMITCGMCCVAWDALGQFSVERKYAQGTDAASRGLFHINPATPSGQWSTDILLGRTTYSSKLENSQGGTLRQLSSEGQNDFMAAGVLGDIGAGLALGASHLRTFHTSETKDQNVREAREEGRAGQMSALRSVVELSENLNFGIAVRFYHFEQNILGAMFVPTAQNTVYRGSMVGTGAGLHLALSGVQFGASYHPPLKGKSEIFGEEYIVTEPGISEASFAWTRPQATFGLVFRRGIYKRDDRVEGTTLNDANQTAINLWGLDPEETTIHFLDNYQLGADFTLSDKASSRVSLTRETLEFTLDPTNFLPGENKGAERYACYRLSGTIQIDAARFLLTFGINLSIKDHKFTSNGNNRFDYENQERDLYVMVNTSI